MKFIEDGLWRRSEYLFQPTLRKVSEKPLKKPRIKNEFAGALRHTFELTDVAVNLLLGTKYHPVLFCMFIFKIKFQAPKRFFLMIKCLQMF